MKRDNSPTSRGRMIVAPFPVIWSREITENGATILLRPFDRGADRPPSTETNRAHTTGNPGHRSRRSTTHRSAETFQRPQPRSQIDPPHMRPESPKTAVLGTS